MPLVKRCLAPPPFSVKVAERSFAPSPTGRGLGRGNDQGRGDSNFPRGQGFTLIEILAALVVVAVALTAAVKLAGQSALNTAYLRDKTYAHWVANYVVAEYRLMEPAPEVGQRKGAMVMGNRMWDWQAELENTEDPAVKRLQVTLSNGDLRTSLVAYIAHSTAQGEAP
jgi:general secretion pathway protein I